MTETSPLRSPGRLEALMRAGTFVMTAETTPPLSASAADVQAKAGPLKGLADAVNVTDGAGARAHLSSLATSAILIGMGIEPVLQFTLRDRNRLALQGDILGAAALGVPNILCIHGDKVDGGDQPDAKMVYDVPGSRELMSLIRDMRDTAKLPSGRDIATPPAVMVGATELPSVPGPDWKPDGIASKIAAGADFFQTQYCFEPATAKAYASRLREEGFTEQAHFIIGCGPLASFRSAKWMNDNLFGVHIPDPILKRMEQAKDEKAEGRRICVEMMQVLAEIPGVAGVHLMAPRQEAACAQCIEESGLLKKRAA
ncbi:MAG: methylenetetrahydrofolate reductase [Alphaproteobacteria bacterium]